MVAAGCFGQACQAMRLRIEELGGAHLDAAADLLAARQTRLLRNKPQEGMLARRFTSAKACRVLLQGMVEDRYTSAVAAFDEAGAMVGYLAGQRQLFAPAAFASVYAEPRSVAVPIHGHAASEDRDAVAVYTTMYAELAEAWVRDGLFVHTVGVPAGLPDVYEAWAELGFGRKSHCAMRSVSVRGAGVMPDGVRLRRLSSSDDDVMGEFHRRLSRFQTGSPMFWPYLPETDAAVSRVRRELLEHGDAACFVAEAGTRHLGMLLFTRPVFLTPLLAPESGLYLWEAFLDPQLRGAGLGEAMLEHAMEWMSEQGIRWCALHYVAGNPQGGPFWRRQGFRVVEYTLRRSIDPRLSWAR
jgi:GNAT superfamily N-acetyltransferase